MGQFLGHRERHHHHVYGRVPFSQRSEQRRDRPVQFFHRALRGRWRVAVVFGVTHAYAVTAFFPEVSQTQHTLFTTRAVPIRRTALAQLLYETLADVAGAQGLVAALGLSREEEEEESEGDRDDELTHPDGTPATGWESTGRTAKSFKSSFLCT